MIPGAVLIVVSSNRVISGGSTGAPDREPNSRIPARIERMAFRTSRNSAHVDDGCDL